MLTKNEREWLERRERHEYPFCISCDAVRTAVDGTGYCYPLENCPLEARIADWQESAEFEARVAAKLAENNWGNVDEDCPPNMAFGWGKLKHARLAVEEEMG